CRGRHFGHWPCADVTPHRPPRDSQVAVVVTSPADLLPGHLRPSSLCPRRPSYRAWGTIANGHQFPAPVLLVAVEGGPAETGVLFGDSSGVLSGPPHATASTAIAFAGSPIDRLETRSSSPRAESRTAISPSPTLA